MSKEKTVEEILIKWINEVMPNYPTATKRPKTLPAKFAELRRDGGERQQMVMDVADFQLEIYDKDSEFNCAVQASDMCDKIEELLPHISDDIAKTKVYGASNMGDTRIQYNSYLIDFSVWYRR